MPLRAPLRSHAVFALKLRADSLGDLAALGGAARHCDVVVAKPVVRVGRHPRLVFWAIDAVRRQAVKPWEHVAHCFFKESLFCLCKTPLVGEHQGWDINRMRCWRRKFSCISARLISPLICITREFAITQPLSVAMALWRFDSASIRSNRSR